MKPARLRSMHWMIPFLLGNLLMLGLIVGIKLGAPDSGAARGRALTVAAFHAHHGPGTEPWGKLSALQFPLNGTEELESAYGRLMGAPKWFFSSVTERQLLRYILSLRLPYRDRQLLLNRKCWRVTATGIEISPADSVVYALDSLSRSKIYAVLARSEANPLYRQAIILPRANFAAQLRALGLHEAQITRLKRLTYLKAGQLCLSDLAVAEKILGQKAFQDLAAYMFAVPAYRLRLVVSAQSDIDALAAYWGRGGHEERIRPILKSLARVPGGTDISISALLPDFPRLRLYRFAEEQHDGPTAAIQNCSFTAMNFFRETPDTNFINLDYTQEVLARDYAVVTDEPVLGDLILMRNEAGELIHICVYLAAEFAFTKNGVSAREPWTIMRIEDVAAIYCARQDAARIELRRAKNLLPAGANDS